MANSAKETRQQKEQGCGQNLKKGGGGSNAGRHY